ncbi:MAG: hypothetical protein K2K96_08950 [Lachnospiraceae bacterium]|nr:hypothetical protein [Lachnospiraceae bacterium]
MGRPRRQTYTMQQYLNNVKEGYISNNAATQRNPAWKPIIDGLVVTILTDDYIPPIILAEEESGGTVIVDGGSRTAAFKMLCNGNYKIKSSVEDPIIKYKKMDKDKKGNTIWNDAEYDIRNKTFEQFPKELQKKFYEYQVETVIHECDFDKVAKYLRRYNIHTGMNANEKMFIYLPKFANKIRKIADRPFFVNFSNFTDNEKEKGMLERSISETVMCMFHLEDWNKQGKKIATYLDEKSSEEEFDKLDDNLHRLENIITDDIKDIFNKKDTFVFLTLFDRFLRLKMDDVKFAEFLLEFNKNLRSKKINGKGLLFDEIDKDASTKDKQVISDKLDMLEGLMSEFLHKEKDLKKQKRAEDFLAENLDMDKEAILEDMDFYNESLELLLENTVRVDSKLRNGQNRLSMLAIMVYSCKENIKNADLEEWMTKYAAKNNCYYQDQAKNFFSMKQDFDRYRKEHQKSA